MNEPTFLAEGTILVTRSRVVIDHHTYPVHSITAVRVETDGTDSRQAILVSGFGGSLALALLARGNVVSGTLGLVLLAIGIVLSLRRSRLRHRLVIGTPSGDVDALVSADNAFLTWVAAAINAALSPVPNP